MTNAVRVVALGGGHGLAQALAALRQLGSAPTAVVTTADDGGSSGRLRRDLDIIAPGDLRMALLTLARNTDLAGALAHRFERGQLEGHALGNLFLVALAEQNGGSFVDGLRQAAALLDCQGQTLPSTVEPVQLHASKSGRQVDGQVSVQTAGGRVERLWLEPQDPAACEEAVEAIRDADLVVLGPGSLFTSVIANLLVPGIAAAVAAAGARLVHIANLLTQPGETSGLDLAGHVDALLAHLRGRRLDVLVLHDGPAGRGPGVPLGATLDHPGVAHIARADLAARDTDGRPAAGHDAARLAGALAPFLDTTNAGATLIT